MQLDRSMPGPTNVEERIEQENPGLPEGPRRTWWVRWSPVWIAVFVLVAGGAAAFLFYQDRYGRNLEEGLRNGAFSDTVSIFVNSRTLELGARASAAETVDDLRRAGFTELRQNPIGWFEIRRDGALVVHAASQTGSTLLRFSANKIVQILALPDNAALAQYQLAPQLIANVSLRSRERRRPLRFGEIPQVLIDAVVSVEDKRFFRHHGFDLFRMVKAAYVNLGQGRAAEGASTITMQLVRSLWLKPDKNWKRKEAQFFMALRLERKLSKQQIFEHYANEVYLGHRGTYDIHGFGEAARVYFDKPAGALSLAEAATLAGVIQRPGYYNPFQFPDRVRTRRNRVLVLMRRNGYITDRDLALATAETWKLSPGAGESVEAPYYVDLVKDEIRKQLVNVRPGRDGHQVHSTLDPRLQRAALEAVRTGMLSVDRQLRNPDTSAPMPQVALVALDPRTGSIKALVGGRDYNESQLNHTLAKRQPGSVFKPFVYAAALRAAERRGADVFTPATLLDDMPTTFWFAQQPYAPTNFNGQFRGEVTLRQALSKSMNVPTIQLAQRVGYRSVVDMARSAGLSQDIQPTPAVALGAYESTPLEIAGAYTVFANRGVYVEPHLVSYVRGDGGARIYSHRPVTHRALTPQVAYLMVNLLEEVLRSGTGAGVRARGFTVPAAGKTGTSRDGWFAGFTSDLVCVVWVGFDDHRDLKLEGAKSALPIWTEFMKQAVALMGPPKPFQRPSGIVTAEVDPLSGQLATPECPGARFEMFVTGTQPVEFCGQHGKPVVDTSSTASTASAQ